jgi:hypothetical protein
LLDEYGEAATDRMVKGDAAMVQVLVEVVVVGLLTMMVGVIWMIVHDFLDNDQYPGNRR